MTSVVVGFGQDAAGDDAVGLWVARRLAHEGIPARESGDATLLLPWLAQGQHVVIIDAVVAAADSGTVLHLRPEALAQSGVSPVSCHGLGVVQALEMARLLYGEVAANVDIVAIAIDRPTRQSQLLSAAASAAIDPACELVRELLLRNERQSKSDGSV
jgi:hydrogenase maturation protease